MTIKKVLSLACVFIALGALSASAAETKPPATKKSTSKNKDRNFNPFEVQQRTRLKMNRFGVFTRVPVSTAASASVVSQSTTDVQASNTLATSTASQTSTATSAATPTATTANTGSVASTQLISAMTSAISPTTAVGTGSPLMASSVYVPPSTAATMSVRPPFRPPVRSPFRPPPRPPF